MRRFMQGMVAGGVLGALGVYLLTPEQGTTMQRAGEKMEDMARRVQRKGTEMMGV